MNQQEKEGRRKGVESGEGKMGEGKEKLRSIERKADK